jgi:hypothetical protein
MRDENRNGDEDRATDRTLHAAGSTPEDATPVEKGAPTENAVTPDPNDELDVPDVMYPSEVDARGDAVNVLREERGLPVPESHDEDRGASYA